MNDEVRAAGAFAKNFAEWSSHWLVMAWVMFLAVWGGLVRVVREVKVGEHTWRTLAWIFFVEMMTSGFAGVMTYLACQALRIPENYTAVLVGISGWMGVRALSALEAMYDRLKPKGD